MEKETEKKGVIFNVKRFSIHDGPGIRTSIFLKGCPLSCRWCHNPEGIDPGISIWHNRNTCIKCGLCIGKCPERALSFNSSGNEQIAIDRSLCRITGNCVEVCPSGAMDFTGRITGTQEIMNEIRKDLVFYNSSGGGVTLTGGEPLFQAVFCSEILKECKMEKIHTALETCLFCDRDSIDRISDLTDLFMVDLKIFDNTEHEEYTGKPNNLILANLNYLASAGKDIVIRIPLIRGITDTARNLRSILSYVNGINPSIPVQYLKYNPLAKFKYQKLGLNYHEW